MEQNKIIAHMGVKAGLLNYVDHETPRYYFLSGHATEEDVFTFAEAIIEKCIDIIEDEDDGSVDTKSARLAMISIKKHFGLETVDDTLRNRSTYFGNDL
jgi:hypothetical protein